jgi:O-antigen/teichoic acid export membrane protein
MSLAFLPIYVRYLGIEAYGLMGIFAMLQTWLTLLDMGMKPTLSREMARFSARVIDVQQIRDLLRSIEIIAGFIAAAIALACFAGAHWLATRWLRLEALPNVTVEQALGLMGAVIALRFIESMYVSTVVGLQRQVLDNVLTIATSTLRGVGAVTVLAYVSPTIGAFFVWQGVVSLITVALYAGFVYKTLPPAPVAARFSTLAVARVWRFASGMTLITLLALLLTQTDKLLLSRLLSLKVFGYYALASSVATSLYLLITPITTAFYPKFTQLMALQNTDALRSAYHQAAQLVSVLAGGCATVFILFPDRILLAWTGDPALTQRVAPLLAVLALGTLLNGIMWVPYQLQLAAGWTSLAIKINVVAVSILIPAILWLVPRYGAIAGAWIWVTLNSNYLVFGIYLMHRRLLRRDKWRWFGQDLAAPLSAALVVGLICRVLEPVPIGRVTLSLVLVLNGSLVIVTALLFAREVRGMAFATMRRVFGVQSRI